MAIYVLVPKPKHLRLGPQTLLPSAPARRPPMTLAKAFAPVAGQPLFPSNSQPLQGFLAHETPIGPSAAIAALHE